MVVKRRGRAGARPGAEKLYRSINKMAGTINAHPYGSGEQIGGKRRGVPVKTLKKILKKAGLKTTGKKAALTRRAKQAKLVKKGGTNGTGPSADIVDTSAVNAAATGSTGGTGSTFTEGGRKRRGKKYFF